MKKLLTLINQYSIAKRNERTVKVNSTYVLSKRFGFIEWLIENNHLILRRDKHKILLTNDGKDIKVSDTDRLIMWLSIEEEPIDELIYLLK